MCESGRARLLDVRGYCSRRFHVQSFGHVFQVLIKVYDQNLWARKRGRVHALGGGNQLAFTKGCKVTKERLTN